jgi:hypothetical protein
VVGTPMRFSHSIFTLLARGLERIELEF